MGVTIQMRDGIAFLAGFIDEQADFSLVPSAGPLTIDFSAVEGLNSLGVQKFVHFTDSWRGRTVTYQNISANMVDAMIMIPMLLGPESNTARIVSLAFPYENERGERVDICVDAKDLRRVDDDIVGPPQPNLAQSDTSEDLLILLECGALPDVAAAD